MNIANSLTTSAGGYALDARQGKELKGKIDVINSNLNETKNKQLLQRDYFLNANSVNGKKDMRLVETYNFYGVNNRNLILIIGADEILGWTSLPPKIVDEKTTWIGERIVLPRTNGGTSTAHIKLELREWYPVPGRVFTCFLNYGTWTPWKSVTPV